MNEQFQRIAAEAWAANPGMEESEFLEQFGRAVVRECARIADNYVAMNVPGAMLGSLMRKQFGDGQ